MRVRRWAPNAGPPRLINEGTPLLPCRPATPQQQRPDDSDQAELQNSASICFQFPFLAYFHELTLAAAVTGASSLALPCLASDLQRDSHLPLGAEGRMPRSHTWRQVWALARGRAEGGRARSAVLPRAPRPTSGGGEPCPTLRRSRRRPTLGRTDVARFNEHRRERQRALRDRCLDREQRSPGACQRPQLHGHHATERRDTWSTRPPVDLGRKEGYRGQSMADSRPPETRSVTYGAWETQSLACVRISQIRS